MGCSESIDRTEKIRRRQIQLGSIIEDNKIKIAQLEKDIANYDAKIKQAEDDLKLNQYTYSPLELKTKSEMVLDIIKDRQRAQRTLDNLRTFNETHKNNLAMVDNKYEEERNTQQIKENNTLMKNLSDSNTADTLQKNIENVIKEKEKQDENKKILDAGNNYINSDLGVQSPEDYLKNLLGK